MHWIFFINFFCSNIHDWSHISGTIVQHLVNNEMNDREFCHIAMFMIVALNKGVLLHSAVELLCWVWARSCPSLHPHFYILSQASSIFLLILCGLRSFLLLQRFIGSFLPKCYLISIGVLKLVSTISITTVFHSCLRKKPAGICFISAWFNHCSLVCCRLCGGAV